MSQIMIVEDDEQLNEVLCYNFCKAGFTVESVLDGDQAVRSLEGGSPPDLILLDVMLPGRSGWEICQHLEGDSSMSSVRVVFYTAKSGREEFDKARNFSNFAGFFVKPYATADVLRHVEKILSERREPRVRGRTRP